MAGPVCEVVTVAKRDLKAGERLDGVGGFCAYGLIENAADGARRRRRCRSACRRAACCVRDVEKDEVISFDDVEQSAPGGLVEALWREQCERWPRGAQGDRCRSAAVGSRAHEAPSDGCGGRVDPRCLIAPSGKARRVFLTGHTGFKGSWLSLWLEALGADVTGYALEPPTAAEPVRAGRGRRDASARSAATFATSRRCPTRSPNAVPRSSFTWRAQSVVRRGYEDPDRDVLVERDGDRPSARGGAPARSGRASSST